MPRPAGNRPGINRFLFLVVIAMAAGYLFSNVFRTAFRDRSPVYREFDVMNTYAALTIPAESGAAGMSPTELADVAETVIRRVDTLMSPFGDLSDIRRLNETPAGVWIQVDPMTWTVVMEALRWHRLSGGAFDPTIGPIKALFRFSREDTVEWPSENALAEARNRVGTENLQYDREGMRLAWKRDGMRFDVGAIAKGYAADAAADALRARGVVNALINIGGELRVLGEKPGSPATPWRAGIRHPRRDDILERLDLKDAAVATSGDYEQYFMHNGVRYEHIIDPRTGLPLTGGPASVTVIHPTSGLAADAMATTMCVLGPEDGEAFLRDQALGLFSEGVRVVMLLPRNDGAVDRIEFTVRDGEVDVTRERHD